MTYPHLAGNLGQPHTANARHRAREVPVNHRFVEAQTLEDHRALIRLQGRDAHLREDFQQFAVDGLDVIFVELVEVVVHRQLPFIFQAGDAFKRHVRVHARRAVANQRGHVVGFPDVARLDQNAHPAAQPFPDEVVVHRRRGQQRRNWRVVRVDGAVGENDDAVAVFDGVFHVAAQPFERPFERFALAVGQKQRINGLRLKIGPVDEPHLVELLRGQHRLLQFHLSAVRG